MGNSINKGFDLFRVLKTWIPCRFRSAKVSRDFWMPDHSCRVCYDCDAQFTVFNRRHHCRLCGRIFCGKCTENSVPAHSFQSSDFLGEWEKVRVCNYCFKQWEQGSASIDHGSHDPIDSVSADSDASSKSSESAFPYQSAMIDPSVDVQFTKRSGRSNITVPYADDASLYQCGSCTNRFKFYAFWLNKLKSVVLLLWGLAVPIHCYFLITVLVDWFLQLSCCF